MNESLHEGNSLVSLGNTSLMNTTTFISIENAAMNTSKRNLNMAKSRFVMSFPGTSCYSFENQMLELYACNMKQKISAFT